MCYPNFRCLCKYRLYVYRNKTTIDQKSAQTSRASHDKVIFVCYFMMVTRESKSVYSKQKEPAIRG